MTEAHKQFHVYLKDKDHSIVVLGTSAEYETGFLVGVTSFL